MNTTKIKPWPYPNSQTFVPAYWNPSEIEPNPPWIYAAIELPLPPLEIRRAVCEMAALDALVEAGIFERISKKSRWGRWRVNK